MTVDALRALALVALIVALGLLEVVLLAGTAFAVGARRQVRELGLVAASGGSPRDIRRIVLAQGLVLGALGAALGVALGFAVAIGGRPLWERLADSEIVGWTFGPAEIAVAALVGLLSGLAAAVLPADRRRADAAGQRAGGPLPHDLAARAAAASWRALALLVAGAACGLLGDRLLADDFAALRARARADPAHGRLRPAPRRPAARSRSSWAARRSRSSGSCCSRRRSSARSRRRARGCRCRPGSPSATPSATATARARRRARSSSPSRGSVVLAFSLAGAFRADELR